MKARLLAAAVAVVAVAALVVAGVVAVRALRTVAPALVPPDGPFDRTAVADWPQGAAGVTLPEATAVRWFTADQVADALTRVRQAMLTARLDPQMVLWRDPAGLLGQLAEDARNSIRRDFADGQFFTYATQVAPGYALADDPPRVKGTTTYRSTVTSDNIRILLVTTDYVWVYPFAGPLAAPGDHLVTIQAEVDWAVPVDADVARSSRGLWIDSGEAFASNIDCTLLDRSLVALGKPEYVAGGDDFDQDALLDPATQVADLPGTC